MSAEPNSRSQPEKTIFGISRRSLVIGFAVWTVLGLSFCSESYLRNYKAGRFVPIWILLIEFLTEFYLYALFSLIVFRVGRRFPLDSAAGGKRLVFHYLVHLLASVVFAMVNVFVGAFIAWLWQRDIFPAYFTLYMILDPHFLHRGVVVYWGIVIVGRGIEYFRGYNSEKIRVAELSSKLSDARLNALKMQIHPHFLFNTLNSIVGLIQEDRRAAELMTTRLSDFLRLTLQSSGEPFVTLEKEFYFLKTYLDIEKVRFENRLSTAFECDESLLAARIPNLILQPLVENSIKHGINHKKTHGRIEIAARRAGARLILTVRDDGDAAARPRGGLLLAPPGGLGLANTEARLRQLYGDDFRFDLKRDPRTGALATIEIPFEV